MRATPFDFPGKGVLESISDFSVAKWKNVSDFSAEPTSVLDTRRSPSPPTTSSSLGGSTDTADVAAVSDNPTRKWPTSSQDDLSAAGNTTDCGDPQQKWASDLHSVPSALEIGADKCGFGMEDWENMLTGPATSPGHEQSFFRLFMADVEDQLKQPDFDAGATPPPLGFGVVDPGYGFESGAGMNINPSMIMNFGGGNPAGSDYVPNSKMASLQSFNHQNQIFSQPANRMVANLAAPMSLPSGLFYQDHLHHHQQQQQQQQQQQVECVEEKPQFFSNTHQFMNQQQGFPQQNPSFFMPLYGQQEESLLIPPNPKRVHAGVFESNTQIPKNPFVDSGEEAFVRMQQQGSLLLGSCHQIQQRQGMPKVGDDDQQRQNQAVVDQLFKAAEMVETGNFLHARGILARLNHQLSSAVGKPLPRAAFYFKEALQTLLNHNTITPNNDHPPSPLDVVRKISAYKLFSEISPILQFVNFTSNQVLLEALDGFNQIHILDFDIGFGSQWASFMQELPLKLGGSPSLKITAFASPSSHHPHELDLTRENLSHFAADLNISFEFQVIYVESFDPSSNVLNLSDNEVVAVNFPMGPSSLSSVPSLLRFVRQLNPKIVVSVDHGADRSDLPFSHHFLHALQSYSILLDSLEAVNANPEAVQKIEKYLINPRIECIVMGRHRAGEKTLPWRTLFQSAGFVPMMPFSNITETQAEWVVKRLQVRGFHVEKRQSTLYLLWQRGELVSVSAWRS